MNLPKVTVVTATYNLIKNGREGYFRQCLESVHNQTHKNIEHIIIDGASNDGTLDLLKEYADKGWITYVSEPDNGIYNAMNKGIMRATGKYVAFLNSDDFWHDPRGVEESIKALEENNADFSYAEALYLRKDGKILKITAKIGAFFIRLPFSHQTMFTKTEILRETLFDEKYKSACDNYSVISLCLKGCKPVFIELIFTTFRDGGFSATDRELSDNETIDIFYTLFSKLSTHVTIDDCKQMYYKHILKKDLLEAIKSVVCPEIRRKIDSVKTKQKDGGIKMYHIGFLKKRGLINFLKSYFYGRG
ncbi:glycosyl transferase [Alphaproteobacteria bacterium]|nr:glycosyl transferase [Alphaproteobacteria bacterium]